jgi:hypothetical protein
MVRLKRLPPLPDCLSLAVFRSPSVKAAELRAE